MSDVLVILLRTVYISLDSQPLRSHYHWYVTRKAEDLRDSMRRIAHGDF
jgi:hypothetical protein